MAKELWSATVGNYDVQQQDRLEFLASHGGPFFELQRRLNLVHEGNLQTRRRILVFVGVAWAIPLLLTLPTFASDTPTLGAYLRDPGLGHAS
jgi:hypothetical protein